MRFHPCVPGKEKAIDYAQEGGVKKLNSIENFPRLLTSTLFILPDESFEGQIERQSSKRLKIETRKGKSQSSH